jgi:hypothetical protein
MTRPHDSMHLKLYLREPPDPSLKMNTPMSFLFEEGYVSEAHSRSC